MSKLFKVFLCITAISLLLVFSAVTAFAEGGLTGVITGNQVNVRDNPNFDAQVVTRLSEGAQVIVSENTNGWYKITNGELTGWISGQFVSIESSSTATAFISGESVNVRNGAGLWADVISRMNDGDKVAIVGRSEDWYNIQLPDGSTGWVRKDFISIGPSRGEDIGRQIISYAKKFIGVPYVYGGSTASGFDCSGFTKNVFANFGIYLERVAADQASQGIWIGQADLRPGDLVFFATTGGKYISHVGIYAGNGTFIHASSGSAKSVTSSGLSDYYSNTFVTAKRVLR